VTGRILLCVGGWLTPLVFGLRGDPRRGYPYPAPVPEHGYLFVPDVAPDLVDVAAQPSGYFGERQSAARRRLVGSTGADGGVGCGVHRTGLSASVFKPSGNYRNREHFKTAIYFHLGGLQLYPATP